MSTNVNLSKKKEENLDFQNLLLSRTSSSKVDVRQEGQLRLAAPIARQVTVQRLESGLEIERPSAPTPELQNPKLQQITVVFDEASDPKVDLPRRGSTSNLIALLEDELQNPKRGSFNRKFETLPAIIEEDEDLYSSLTPPPSHPAIDETEQMTAQVKEVAYRSLHTSYEPNVWFDERKGAFPYNDVSSYCKMRLLQKYSNLLQKGTWDFAAESQETETVQSPQGAVSSKPRSVQVQSKPLLEFISYNMQVLDSEIMRLYKQCAPSDSTFILAIKELEQNASYLYQVVFNHYSRPEEKELAAITLKELEAIGTQLKTHHVAIRKLQRQLQKNLELTEGAILKCQEQMHLAHRISNLDKDPSVTHITLPTLAKDKTVVFSDQTSPTWKEDAVIVKNLYEDHFSLLQIHRTYFLKCLLAAKEADSAYGIARNLTFSRIAELKTESQ